MEQKRLRMTREQKYTKICPRYLLETTEANIRRGANNGSDYFQTNYQLNRRAKGQSKMAQGVLPSLNTKLSSQ